MGYFIDIRWYVEDVQEVRPDLNPAQCEVILRHIDDYHDANEGVNWEVIKIVAESTYPITEEQP